MGQADFENYGKGKLKFAPENNGPLTDFVGTSGGPIDPYGDWEKKEKDALDMNAGIAYNKKDYTKVDAMGTPYPKKSGSQVEEHEDGDHFDVEVENADIAPFGTDCGKSQSFQPTKRGKLKV